MKLYICSSGSYSDYGIEAIFMDKEKAEEYTRLLKCDNEIEEFETEDENWINKPHNCKYYLRIIYSENISDNKESIRIYKDYETNYNSDFSDDNYYPYTRKYISYHQYGNSFDVNLNYPCNKDIEINKELNEKYLKICRDYISQAKQLLTEGHNSYDLNEIMFGSWL